jgi:pSer/pThr/pTyr-binding forkhead associated (FHA) protein
VTGGFIVIHVSECDRGGELMWAPGAVSSLHAKVTATAKGVSVQDLGSTNGTFVDGKKVRLPRTREAHLNQEVFLRRFQ